MAQRQFLTSDTSVWSDKYGTGSDGALTISSDTTEAPIDASCSGTAGTTSLSATNASFATGQLLLIHQTRGTGVGTWELNKISSYVAGTITTSYSLINTYTDSGASQAQVRVLKQYSAVTINSAKTYTAKAWDGDVGGILAFVCNGTTTVTGTISANGSGFRGGLGNNNSGSLGDSGEGTAGASVANSSAANGNGGGGGKSTGGPTPSGGGNGTAGSEANGGAIVGNAGLTLMDFGGGGGGRGMDSPAQNDGTRGGGIILIISKTLSVTGTITGLGLDHQTNAGAGAGGSVLLKGQALTLGSTLTTATGGAGDGSGGAGGTGRIHADYSTSISGTTNPTLDSTQDAILADVSVPKLFLFV